MDVNQLSELIRSFGYTTWGQSREIAEAIRAALADQPKADSTEAKAQPLTEEEDRACIPKIEKSKDEFVSMVWLKQADAIQAIRNAEAKHGIASSTKEGK